MINRELIRIKVVQLTYAYYQNGSNNMANAEKELLYSLSKGYDLYNYLLMLIGAVTKEEDRRAQIAIQRAWDDHLEFVRKLCNQIEMSPIYQEYMASEDDSYDADREVWRKIYKTLVQDNTELESVLEEKSLYWNDDKEVVDTFVLKTIKRFDEKNGAAQELLPEFKDLEDKEFARKLFRATILNADTYQRYMSETSRHWDFSRLAYMDVVIMQIAIAEMMTFPNIPVSVTINEYVDLAKVYSTYKSSGYINGMLDAIARHLIHEGLLLKTMGTRQNGDNDDSNNNQQ